MSLSRRAVLVGLLFIAQPALSAAQPPAAPAPVRVLSARTIARSVDPVVVPGAEFPAAAGLALEGFRMFAERGGSVVPVCFDLNERDEDGLYILDQGPKATKGTGIFAASTELAFMARDAGGRIDAGSALPPGGRIFTILLQDPRDWSLGWVYLAWYERNPPPRCGRDGVSLTVSEEADPRTGTGYAELAGQTYRVRNAEDATVWYDFRGGGKGSPEYADHVSVAFDARFYPWVPFHKDEWQLKGETRAWSDGVVRAIRRIKITVSLRIGKVTIARIPARIVYDVVAYDNLVIVPVKIWSPFSLKYLSMKAAISYGLDLSAIAKGRYRWYSNVHPEGFDIDGKAEDGEKKIRNKLYEMPSRDYWSAQVGPYGTVFRRHITPQRFERMGIKFHLAYTDDEDKIVEHDFSPGLIGSYKNVVDVHPAPHGVFSGTSYWFFPAKFSYPEDLQPMLDVLDRPILVRVDGREPVPGLKSDE